MGLWTWGGEKKIARKGFPLPGSFQSELSRGEGSWTKTSSWQCQDFIVAGTAMAYGIHPSLMRDFWETHIWTREGHPHKISKHSKRTGSSHVGNIVNKQEWLRWLPETCRRLSRVLLPIAVGTEGRGKRKRTFVVSGGWVSGYGCDLPWHCCTCSLWILETREWEKDTTSSIRSWSYSPRW